MQANLTPEQTDQLLEDYSGNVTEDQLLDALSFAISNLEVDPEISRKAYKMRLENIITTDEYNPETRTLKTARRSKRNRVTNDQWVNRIPDHCKASIMMMVDDIFEMLESGTSVDELNVNGLRNRITELFINMRQFNLNYEHFNKIRHYILKTLDSYGQVDLMVKVSKFDS